MARPKTRDATLRHCPSCTEPTIVGDDGEGVLAVADVTALDLRMERTAAAAGRRVYLYNGADDRTLTRRRAATKRTGAVVAEHRCANLLDDDGLDR
jgi:hypothetical protein